MGQQDTSGIKKAKTAVFFGIPRWQIGKLSQPGGSLFGIEHSNGGLITFPGGLPIVDTEGVLVGVSGSSVENDHAVALAGAVSIGVSDLPEHPWRTIGVVGLFLWVLYSSKRQGRLFKTFRSYLRKFPPSVT